jgi:hypothetical protein
VAINHEAAARRRWDTGNVDQVLDTHRGPVQRTNGCARATATVGGASGLQGSIFKQADDGIQLATGRVEPS